MTHNMNQITLRKIPESLGRVLKKEAQETGQSMNAVVLKYLKKATGFTSSVKKRDLSKLAGTWSSKEADAFLQKMKDFEKIDEDVWK